MCDRMTLARRCLATAALAVFIVLAGCAAPGTRVPERRPEDIRAETVHLLPSGAKDREGWAADIAAAFDALHVDATTSNLCAAIAVVGQESNFVADPVVPGLGRIARAEIDRRAGQHHVPQFVVAGALSVHSSNGKSYADRIASVRTERELSLVYEDLIARVPLGRQLFADANPVHTGGPMQVERHVRRRPCGRARLSVSGRRLDPPRSLHASRRRLLRGRASARLSGRLRPHDLSVRRLQRGFLFEPQRGVPERARDRDGPDARARRRSDRVRQRQRARRDRARHAYARAPARCFRCRNPPRARKRRKRRLRTDRLSTRASSRARRRSRTGSCRTR